MGDPDDGSTPKKSPRVFSRLSNDKNLLFLTSEHHVMNNIATYREAIQRCRELLERAQAVALSEPMAVSLATVNVDGQPSVRMVLLRGFDERGFVFYTNSQSRKGRELDLNPRAALCFYWDALREQLRVQGKAERVSEEESDTYWEKRPRLSQLTAVASRQSEILEDPQNLVDRVAELERRYENGPVPRPDHWYGYRVVPSRIEFWTGRDGRMHERSIYEDSDQGWTSFFVYP